MEAESHTAALSAGLVSLEETSASPEAIDPLMRAAHSLKGAARIVGLDAIVRVAHAMEDCFVQAQKGKLVLRPEHVDVLLRGVDLLAQVAQLSEAEVEAWQHERANEIDALVAELTMAKENRLPAHSTPPPSPAHPAVPASAAVSIPVFGEKPVEARVVSLDRAEGKIIAPMLVSPVPSSLLTTETRADSTPVPAGPGSAVDRDRDRVVRVTAESLTRLLSLAGEALVQSHRFAPLVDSLWRLKGKETGLLESLQVLEDHISNNQENMLTAGDRDRLAGVKAQASQCLQTLGETLEAIEEFARRSEELSSRLHHEVLASRMRPLADGIRGFPRLVRDLARELGKQARLEVVGETTGVDRDILDRLEAPLNHLIRNALDHGVDLPEERRAAGKQATGTIRLEARHRAGMLQIILSDDGRGIDLERLRAKVVERELTTAPIAAQLSEAELLEFLFLPGFSTKEHVTEVSGRGVGLDVVHNMVRSVGGVVRINTRSGKGTRFVLQLPITVSVIRALWSRSPVSRMRFR